MQLRLLRSDHIVSEVHFSGISCTLGSDPHCALCTPDPAMPPLIAEISGSPYKVYLSSPLSKLDLFWNGKIVTDPVLLTIGDTITIGDFVLEILEPPPHEEELQDIDEDLDVPITAPRTSVERLNQFVSTQLPPGSTTRKPEEEVTLHEGQLAIVNEVVQTLSGAESIEGVMDLALQVLLSCFGAQRSWIGVRKVNYGPMDYVAGLTSTGQSAELTELGENLKPRILDRAQYVSIPMVDIEDQTTIMAGPLAGTEGLLGMVYVDRECSRGSYKSTDLDLFAMVVTLIGAQVDAILKQVAKNRGAMIAGEVSVAHMIQSRLTPRKLAVWPEQLQFGAFREPGNAHSNNIYDIVKLANNMALFMVAHTPAGGWAPCVLIAQAIASFRYSAMHLNAPHIMLKTLNWILCDGQRDHDLCMFLGVIEPTSGRVHYSVAGRTPAYIINVQGDERNLMPATIPPPLGADRMTDYPQLSEHFEPSETLALFTPGVNLAQNRDGEIMGEARIVETLCDGFGQTASALLKDLFNDVNAFIENGQQPEDITFVLAHRL